MKKEDIYYNEKACELLLDFHGVAKLIQLLAYFTNDSQTFSFETVMNPNALSGITFKVDYEYQKQIKVTSSDQREMTLSVVTDPFRNRKILIDYKLRDCHLYYTLTAKNINTDFKNIDENEISIEQIEYKNHRFKTSFVPLTIVKDGKGNKFFNYQELGINIDTLKPGYYGDYLPDYKEVENYNADEEKKKLRKFIYQNGYTLAETTKNLILGLSKSIDTCEETYKKIVGIYNEWLYLLEEHKEMIDQLYRYSFNSKELNFIADTLNNNLDNENAKELILKLSPQMLDAMKRLLNNR